MRTNYPMRDIGREVDYEAVKRRAFVDQRILVARLDDPRLDSFERQFLENIGNKITGPRHR
jgi:hypothetical protein